MEQMGFDLGAPPLPEIAPAFANAADFERALAAWVSGAKRFGTAAQRVFAHPVETPYGTMVAICDAQSLHLLEFADRKTLAKEVARLAETHGKIAPGQTHVTRAVCEQLALYFKGELTQFDLPLTLHGTEFTQSVWRALIALKHGETISYGALAERLGNPSATRAVARANGANQIAIVVPCHRVIGADGSLTGYAGGLWRKQALLELEAGSV